MNNQFRMKIRALTENVAFARSCISAFCVGLNPSLEQLDEIKTSSSEAITNAIVHAYPTDGDNYIWIEVRIEDANLTIIVEDEGVGIEDISQAIQPFFTTKAEEEHSGMGFTLINSFMDKVDIISTKDKGTRVVMQKNIAENTNV